VTNAELLDLLREAQSCVEEAAEAFGHLDAKTNGVLRRIKAALAEEERRTSRICSCGNTMDLLHYQLGVRLCAPCLAKAYR
jgi:hypothetical protein